MKANTFLTLTMFQSSDLCLILSAFHFMIKAETLLQPSVKRKQFHPLYDGLGVWALAVFSGTSLMRKKAMNLHSIDSLPCFCKHFLVFSEQTHRVKTCFQIKTVAWLPQRSALSERQSGLRCKHLIVYRHPDKTHCLFLL